MSTRNLLATISCEQKKFGPHYPKAQDRTVEFFLGDSFQGHAFPGAVHGLTTNFEESKAGRAGPPLGSPKHAIPAKLSNPDRRNENTPKRKLDKYRQNCKREASA